MRRYRYSSQESQISEQKEKQKYYITKRSKSRKGDFQQRQISDDKEAGVARTRNCRLHTMALKRAYTPDPLRAGSIIRLTRAGKMCFEQQ